MTTAELLAEVETAIQTVAVGGQSYTIGSRSMTRADLKTLYSMRNDLTAQLVSESSANGLMAGCYVAEFDGR